MNDEEDNYEEFIDDQNRKWRKVPRYLTARDCIRSPNLDHATLWLNYLILTGYYERHPFYTWVRVVEDQDLNQSQENKHESNNQIPNEQKEEKNQLIKRNNHFDIEREISTFVDILIPKKSESSIEMQTFHNNNDQQNNKYYNMGKKNNNSPRINRKSNNNTDKISSTTNSNKRQENKKSINLNKRQEKNKTMERKKQNTSFFTKEFLGKINKN